MSWFRSTKSACEPKALSVFEDLRGKSPNPAEVVSFGASRGWCGGLKCRYNFQSLQLLGKFVRADEKTINEFPAVIQRLYEERGCILDPIFSFDETGNMNACLERPTSQRQEIMSQDLRLLRIDKL